jgi:hypothetical protein
VPLRLLRRSRLITDNSRRDVEKSRIVRRARVALRRPAIGKNQVISAEARQRGII